MTAASELVLVEVDGPVGILRLNRPEKLNAINVAMAVRLAGRLEAFDRDDSIRAIVLGSSTERAFSSGADMHERLSQMESADASGAETAMEAGARLLTVASSVHKPTIGVIEGYCYGGGLWLALSLDLLIAAESARFKNPGVELGIATGAVKLHGVLGPAVAKEFIMTAEVIDAATAQNIGLVNHAVPAGEAWPKAIDIAHRISRNSPLAVAAVKRLVNEAAENAELVAREVEVREALRASGQFANRYRDAVNEKLG